MPKKSSSVQALPASEKLNGAEIQRRLDAWARDPALEMDKVPEKRDAKGNLLRAPESAFSREDLRDNRYVELRDQVRSRFSGVVNGRIVRVEDLVPSRAAIAANDRPEDLVDRLDLKTLNEIEAASLRSAELDESPWSDDYWPIYRGILGRRYGDNGFPDSDDWKANHDYIVAHKAKDIFDGGDSRAIDRLSPSEKYDLLAGIDTRTLTDAMWEEGRRYHQRDGKVEKWMGICHGWAPAAYMLPRPRRAVSVKAANGQSWLRFYPADIKALASLLWANAGTETRFVGGRNDEKNPNKDANGRLISSDAFDTNPGTWHLAIVNQIGKARRSFIMDATYDYEVWNQPLLGYEYSYFNPETMAHSDSLQASIVSRADFSNDRFATYRSAAYAKVVGVFMRARYVVETWPVQRGADGPERDAHRLVDYMYDLELDANDRILGGEWYQNRHPDFLWTPPPWERGTSSAESLAIGTWTKGSALPGAWRTAAARVARYGLPLAKIVERLIALANGA